MEWMLFPSRRIAGATLALLASAVFTAAFSLLSGCHSEPPLTSRQLAGRDLYQSRCAHCHEENDLGLKKVPPNLHHVFESATLPSGAPATDLQVERTILSGKGMMPSFAGRFSQDQMTALLAYLHTGLRDLQNP